MNTSERTVDACGRCRIEDQPDWHYLRYAVPAARPTSATVTTPTAFPGFAPGEHRKLLAAISLWRRQYGWTIQRDTGWQNPSRIIQVDWDERGLHIGSRDGVDRIWPNPTPYPATSVRQAVDLLVALEILPARFARAYEAGWHDGFFHTVEDETRAELAGGAR